MLRLRSTPATSTSISLIEDSNGVFSVCTYNATCEGGSYTLMTNADHYIDYATSGTISVAPEPSSLMLLATGALGAAGLMPRKLSRSHPAMSR
jgi:hypothetical protein